MDSDEIFDAHSMILIFYLSVNIIEESESFRSRWNWARKHLNKMQTMLPQNKVFD